MDIINIQFIKTLEEKTIPVIKLVFGILMSSKAITDVCNNIKDTYLKEEPLITYNRDIIASD